MNSIMKRISTGLLALLMVLSLVFVGLPTEASAATGSYSYNTGTRHDYSATLSSQATAYYTGNYTWKKLSALQGGTEDCLDMSSPMFEALNTLMSTTMTNSVSYSSLPDYWEYTDASGGSSGTIWFYADNTGSGTMSREHVWPKSHASFHEKDGGCDLHHLRPSISNINSSRGNLIMGNVQGLSGASTYEYGGEVVLYKTSQLCEVNDNIKGDVARIFLYVWCRWEEPNLFKDTPNPVIGSNDSANDGGKVIESLDTLLEWCQIDPVDTWEMSRNDQTEKVQGNRNVFIDYPEFAWLIFGRDVPAGYNTPSDNGGSSSGSGCSHSWTAATCTAPKTCQLCGTTEGSALGHSWKAATCTAPKTCTTCGTTSGSTAAHADSNGDNACDTCGTSMGSTQPPVSTGSGYILITSADQLTTGQYVMISDKGYAPGVYDNGWLTAVQPTVSGDKVTDAAGGIWTLTVDGTSVTLTDANGVTVKPKSGNNNGIQNGAYDWAWEFTDGTFKFKGTGTDTTTLASNTTSGNKFRGYKNATVSSGSYPCNFQLYKLVEETTHEHSYTSTVTTAPTCTAAGVTTYTCSCGDSYTEAIAALGHSYNAVVTAPTCVDAGYTTYTCTVCGDSYKENGAAATGEHNYVDGTCSVCGATSAPEVPTDANLVFVGAPGLSFQDYIGMQIMARNKTITNLGYTSFYVEITQVDFEGNVTTTQTTGAAYGSTFTFFEQQILSWSMTEEVTMTLYGVKDGVAYKGQSFTTSVEALALEKIPSYVESGDMARAKALVDMLNFGSAVQTAYTHNETNLPNADLGSYAAYGTTDPPDFEATNEITGSNSIKIYSHNISMQSKVEFQFMVKTTDLEGKTVVAKMGDADATVAYETMGTFTILRVACGAAYMREIFTIVVNDANGNAVTGVYDVSVEAYAATQLEGEKAPAMVALLKYGDSVAEIG